VSKSTRRRKGGAPSLRSVGRLACRGRAERHFLIRNPHQPYIAYNDLQKIANLKRVFANAHRDEPIRVSAVEPD
jgi:peptide-methionine (S)-S-oxide reductase